MFEKGLKTVNLYTDGACSGNPGPGGYGYILSYNGHEKVGSQGFRLTTNNRMEIMAVIEGLSALKETCNVNIYSDSKYVIDAITLGWVYKWEANGWIRDRKRKASNVDLWEQLLVLLDEHNVELIWVKGHAGNPNNERCDRLAVSAYQSDNLIDDEGYIPEEN
ncbi:MAG: ribonuclease HI [Clostridia bacterium]|nr:ribonuclease HI [Clostridia bacterium]